MKYEKYLMKGDVPLKIINTIHMMLILNKIKSRIKLVAYV